MASNDRVIDLVRDVLIDALKFEYLTVDEIINRLRVGGNEIPPVPFDEEIPSYGFVVLALSNLQSESEVRSCKFGGEVIYKYVG